LAAGCSPETRRGAWSGGRSTPDRCSPAICSSRSAAIGRALPGDVVLVAGKGHEKYQEIAGRTLAFDDVAVAREALEARRLKSRVG